MSKKCSTCKLFKEVDLFNRDKGKKDCLMSRCRDCVKSYQKLWVKDNVERVKNKNSEWRAVNNEALKANKKKYYQLNKEKILQQNREKYAKDPNYFKDIDLKKTYGINLDQYNNLLSRQGESCAICKRPKNEFTKALAVDHCHKTGKIRGLLCANCNRAVGNLKDSAVNAESAASYLRRSSENF